MKRLERDILANTSPSAVLTFAQKFLINFDIVKTDLPETKELGLSEIIKSNFQMEKPTTQIE